MTIEHLVHIVDDDARVRRSLRQLLQAAGFTVLSYSSALACLQAAPRLSGCLLLDLRMPGMDGLQLQQELAARGVRVPVIVLTGQADVRTAVRAMKAGAFDFIEKPYDPVALVAAVAAASADSAPALRNADVVDAKARVAALSRREREVLDRLASGRANKTIAFDLGISARTVEVHRARMLERLGVRRVAEAIRLWVLATLA